MAPNCDAPPWVVGPPSGAPSTNPDDLAWPGPTRPLHLAYDDKLVTLNFAALDFTSPANNRYSYRLEGFDPAWIDAGAGNRRIAIAAAVRSTSNDGSSQEFAGCYVAWSAAPPRAAVRRRWRCSVR